VIERSQIPISYKEAGVQIIPPEQTLRNGAIELLKQKTSASFLPLVSLYSPFELEPRPKHLKKILIAGLETAQKGPSWKTNKETETINIGYYSNMSNFYTNLFHEGGHFTLNNLGRDTATYQLNPEPEESFCWKFAEGVTNLLDLPFSPQRVALSTTIFEVLDQLSTDSSNPRLIKKLDRLIAREKALQGFSEDLSTCVWTPSGVPQIIKQ